MNKDISKHFSGDIRSALMKISEGDFPRCQELRLRVNRSLSVYTGDETYILDKNGQLFLPARNFTGIKVTEADMKYTFESICEYSVHSFSREIKSGFITVAGGHRAGFCGTAVSEDAFGKTLTVKNISSINFRIAREVKGAANNLLKRLMRNFRFPSVLICGSVGSGKTTLLRDLSRQLGDYIKISMIDSRGELAAVYNGVPALDVGVFTDVFDGYSKAEGIETAVRVMSPQIIVCDEIGSDADMSDIKALRFAKLSGVTIIASCHAASIEDIRGKNIPEDMFDFAVFLKGSEHPAEILTIAQFEKKGLS
ncbi:MAG: stage III sporulation protein AA [Ruminococcus sp.]|jgi:stage III sporulation protein AA|nr:stage III sporulation protein AA [Ruminococcus sp.]